jgi:Predicted O-methyltransferase
MVESYGKYSNPNMRRPVVKEEIVDFLRNKQAPLDGYLLELENFAHENNIPIIPHETVVYFNFILQILNSKKILEVGTAIGFSALLMNKNLPEAQITTIERNPEMAKLAEENFTRYDLDGNISLLEGDALELLPTLDGKYDLAFMDSAKSKYIVFLPEILRLLEVGGVVIIDDVFQGGDITRDVMDIVRNQRAIHRGLTKLFNAVLTHDKLTSSLVPLGDGILMIRKNEEFTPDDLEALVFENKA